MIPRPLIQAALADVPPVRVAARSLTERIMQIVTGSTVTARGLANVMGVSVSRVRYALRKLCQQGRMVRLNCRRYCLPSDVTYLTARGWRVVRV